LDPDSFQLSIDEARANVIKTVRFFAVDDATLVFVLPDQAAEDKAAALFGGEPLPIFDVQGRLLFYEFVGRSGQGLEVRARAGANTLLGAPVFSVSVGAPVDMVSQAEQAAKRAAALGLRPLPLPRALVAYSYPKLGLLCKDAVDSLVVVDLFEFRASPVRSPWETLQVRAEAPAIWSPIDRVHAASFGERREQWDNNLSVVSDSEAGPAGAEEHVIEGVQCVGQQNERFCAVACAKMILDFHGITLSQQAISEAMRTGADGSTNEDQVRAYGQLSNRTLAAKLDSTASFREARDECQDDRPMKSGVPGHARAVAGWRVQTKGALTSSWLWLLDPWPVGSGRTYWENWDAIPHSNFIYVAPRA
jgi:Peptidase_C39 like family